MMVYYTLIIEVLKDGKPRTYQEVWHEIIERFNVTPNYIRIRKLLTKMTRKGVIEVVNPNERKRIIRLAKR